MKKIIVAIAIALASTSAFASEKVSACTDAVNFAAVTVKAKASGTSKEVIIAIVEETFKESSSERVEFAKSIVENVWSNKYKSAADRNNQVMLTCLKTL